MEEYKVTITIEGSTQGIEEIQKQEYWIEADSFEEAVEMVKYELGIQ